jgi:hypothetical protein
MDRPSKRASAERRAKHDRQEAERKSKAKLRRSTLAKAMSLAKVGKGYAARSGKRK